MSDQNDDELEDGFCIKGDLERKCKNPKFDEFPTEFDIINLILEYFQVFLPVVMSNKVDHGNRPIKIDPKDIGVTITNDPGDYLVVLVPTDDNSSYPTDNYAIEDTEYVFQMELEVKDNDSEAALENLLKLKSGVKTMLVNMDYNLGLNVNIDGFSHAGPFSIEGTTKIVRNGIYRFSIRDTRYKTNA